MNEISLFYPVVYIKALHWYLEYEERKEGFVHQEYAAGEGEPMLVKLRFLREFDIRGAFF